MCNIAGYVGERDAAPILLELIRKQEGWAGGYYTGIATVSEGRLYYAKLTGDTDRLVALTGAAKLPGKIGIIHSRSKSGGGDEWSHPFIGAGEKTAYIANGAAGFFKNGDLRDRYARELWREGYTMRSRCEGQVGSYPSLGDGTCVHMSDVMCQLIARYIDRGTEGPEAMERAFCDIPSEIVGLSLSVTEPDAILWARFNMPVNVGFAPHGAYLASTPTAFPEDASGITPLPSLSCGRVTRDGFSVKKFSRPPCTVAPVSGRVYAAAYAAVTERLKTGEKCSFRELGKLVAPLFDPADCTQKALVVYLVLNALKDEGRLRVAEERVPGAREDLDAPKFYARTEL